MPDHLNAFSLKPVKRFWFLLFLSCKIGWAQTVQLSDFNFSDSQFEDIRVVGYTDNGYFVLQSNLPFESLRDRVGFKSRKYRLSFFTTQLTRLWVRPIEIDPPAAVQGVYFLKDQILAISVGVTKEASHYYARIRLQLYNDKGVQTDKIPDSAFQLSEAPEKIQVCISNNRRLIAILLPEFIREDCLRLHALILDSVFTPLSRRSMEIPCQRKNFFIEDCQLSDRGDLALLTIHKVRENKKRTDEYRIHYCTLSAESFEHLIIAHEKQETAGAGIVFDNHHSLLLCAGFSAEPSLSSRTSIFIYRIPLTDTSSIVRQLIPVDDRYKFKLASVPDKKGATGLFSYPIRNLILRNDGGLVLIAEAFFTYEYSYYDYFTQSYMRRTDYQFNNIVGISIHPEGTIHWLHVIRKNQQSTDDGGIFSSFLQMTTDAELIMMYNADDNRYNEVRYSVIDATGRFEESRVIRLKQPLALLPRFGRQVSANEAVMPCLYKRNLSVAKVIF